jgi:hypothetical protein
VWKETIDPECVIEVLVSDVKEPAVDLVLSTFDEATNGIKNKNWYKNLLACKNGAITCPYHNLCWRGDGSDVVCLGEKKV